MKALRVLFTSFLFIFLTANQSLAGSLAEKVLDFLLGQEAMAASTARSSNAMHSEVELDAVGKECMACHHGSRATRIPLKDVRDPMRIIGTRSVDHPVGMSYDEAVRKDPRGYRNRAFLNPSIAFVDGKVTCISCHRLRQSAATQFRIIQASANEPRRCMASKELTAGPTTSDLCLACHQK